MHHCYKWRELPKRNKKEFPSLLKDVLLFFSFIEVWEIDFFFFLSLVLLKSPHHHHSFGGSFDEMYCEKFARVTQIFCAQCARLWVSITNSMYVFVGFDFPSYSSWTNIRLHSKHPNIPSLPNKRFSNSTNENEWNNNEIWGAFTTFTTCYSIFDELNAENSIWNLIIQFISISFHSFIDWFDGFRQWQTIQTATQIQLSKR